MKFNKILNEQRDIIQQAKTNFITHVYEEQRNCVHDRIADSDFLGQPVRICLKCGMSELGWGPGYLVLTDEFRATVTRSEYRDWSVGLFITDEKKSLLIKNRDRATNSYTNALKQILNDWYESQDKQDKK